MQLLVPATQRLSLRQAQQGLSSLAGDIAVAGAGQPHGLLAAGAALGCK